MRRAGLVVLACAVAAGCITPTKRQTVPDIVRSLTPPLPAEGILVKSILLERPTGDAFLDREIWDATLPVGTPEARALFAENGLRVGILGGNPPRKFQVLFESDADTVSPQLLTFHLRKEAVIATAGPVDPCRFTVLTDFSRKPKSVDLKQAGCGLFVRPEEMPDGRVKLCCEPRIQHGERQQRLRPNEDVTRFEKHDELSVEKYAELGFDVAMRPENYLLIGWSSEQTDTLGEAMFAAEASGRERQRVLVIRAWQANPSRSSDLPPIPGGSKRPSIAAQAAVPRK